MKAPPIIGAIIILCLVSYSVGAQAQKPSVVTFQLGNQILTVPAPEGFEEATSQFESIKSQFNRTEAAGNDVLAVHLLHTDCEKLRAGEFGPFNFYTKISVQRGVRNVDYSALRFANLVAEFRKDSGQILNVNSPETKAILERLGKGLSELSNQETQVNLGQPVNLGEFDKRPNVYSVMLLMNLKSQTSDGESNMLIAGGLSLLRVKQRLIYVYTYRKYGSKTDVETLRDFTKQWVSQILAAN